jgi:Sulfotransferase family
MKNKIIYITGAGRSGSTLLDIILGKNKDVVSVGELINLTNQGWINNEYCSCGKRVKECEFWQCIRGNITDEDIAKYNRIRAGFIKLKYIIDIIFIRGHEAGIDYQLYNKINTIIIDNIYKCSNKHIIIDSSKNPTRALSLIKGINNNEFFIIHLVRDVRGYVWSNLKSFNKDIKGGVQTDFKPRSILSSIIRWNFTNIASEIVKRRTNYVTIRYEDFVNNPKDVLEDISSFTGVNFCQDLKSLNKIIIERHTVAGNRLRMQKDISIKQDVEWKENLSNFQKCYIYLFSILLMKKYSY